MSFRQKAINELFFNGIGITGREFDKLLKNYNNFEMSLSERAKLISNDPKPFIKYIKQTEAINEG